MRMMSRCSVAAMLAAVLAAVLAAPAAHAGATTGDLLFFNRKTNTLLAKDQQGVTKVNLQLKSRSTYEVLPGAVAADGFYAFNPARSAVTSASGSPKLVITQLTNPAKVHSTKTVPTPTGLTGCRLQSSPGQSPPALFDIGIAASAPHRADAAGEGYFVALALSCGSKRYVAQYAYLPNDRLSFIPGSVVSVDNLEINSTKYTANAIQYFDDELYIIAISTDGAAATAFGSAAVFSVAVDQSQPESQAKATLVGTPQSIFDTEEAAACYNFRLRSVPNPDATKLAAACASKGPGLLQSIYLSGEKQGVGTGLYNNTEYAGVYDSLAASPGGTFLYTLVEVNTASVKKLGNLSGTELSKKNLFTLPSKDFGDIQYVP